MCFALALAYALALASIVNYDCKCAPNCRVTYDRHYDDHNSFIIQATGRRDTQHNDIQHKRNSVKQYLLC